MIVLLIGGGSTLRAARRVLPTPASSSAATWSRSAAIRSGSVGGDQARPQRPGRRRARHLRRRASRRSTRGTLATIGQLSLTGVANRFVGLTLRRGRPAIPSGGTLPVTQTRGIVDLDVVLDALTPQVRALAAAAPRRRAPTSSRSPPPRSSTSATQLPQSGAQPDRGSSASEVVADKFALQRLVASTAQVVERAGRPQRRSRRRGQPTPPPPCARSPASARRSRTRSPARPAVLAPGHQACCATSTTTLHVLDPTLRDLRPVAPRLATLLRRVLSRRRSNAVPTIAGRRRRSCPARKKRARRVPAGRAVATPAVQSLTAALPPITPILAGLRPYTPDVVAGFFNGVGGATGGALRRQRPLPQVRCSRVQGGGASLSGLLEPARRRHRHAGAVQRRAHPAARAVPGRRHPAGRRRQQPVDLARRAARPPATSAIRRTTRDETARACIAACALAAASVGAAGRWLGSSAPRAARPRRFDVIFDDARGLVGGPAGQDRRRPAGTIQNVVVTPDFKARIEASVDSRFMPFHQDATCTIRPEGLIAENYVECDPGTPAARRCKRSGRPSADRAGHAHHRAGQPARPVQHLQPPHARAVRR